MSTFFELDNTPNPLNAVQLVGKLMKAPFVNETTSGRSVARVLLVVQRPGRGASANIQLVDWGDDWGASQSNPKSREGQTLHELSANTPVRIQGELVTRSFESSKHGGARIYSTEVDVRSIEVLGDEEYRAYTQDAVVTALS